MLEVRRADPGTRNGAAPADCRGGIAAGPAGIGTVCVGTACEGTACVGAACIGTAAVDLKLVMTAV